MSVLKTVANQSKYGLIKKGSGGNLSVKKPKLSIFQADENENEESEDINEIQRVNRILAAKGSTAMSSSQLSEFYKQAKAEDETDIYDYDGVYDSMKASVSSTHPLPQAHESKDAPKARYINSLKAAAKLREKESDRVYERKLLKEKLEGGEEFEDKPQFITSAYKERLKEKEQWEYEERLQEELDKQTDVRKKGMLGFYSNLLTKNIALGGNVEENAISAYTIGGNRSERLVANPPTSSSSSSTAISSALQDDKAAADERVENVPSSTLGKRPAEEESQSQDDESVKQARVAQSNEAIEEEKVEASIPQVNKVEIIQSARERYLARKQQQALS